MSVAALAVVLPSYPGDKLPVSALAVVLPSYPGDKLPVAALTVVLPSYPGDKLPVAALAVVLPFSLSHFRHLKLGMSPPTNICNKLQPMLKIIEL